MRRRLPLLWILFCVATAGWGETSRCVAADPDPSSNLAKARAAAAEKDAARALPLFFDAIREATDYETRFAIRDEVLALPPVPARALDDGEKGIVAARIAEERERDVEKKAGAMEGKGAIHGAYILRERLMTMEGTSTEKASQIEQVLERMRKTICDDPTDAEKAEAKAMEGDLAHPETALERAIAAADAGKGRVALRVLSAVSYSGVATQEVKDRARAEIEKLRRRLVENVPEAERAEAETIWQDPHWKGLATSVSHQFVFIGAKDFVETISPLDRIRMDLACVLIGDFIGRDLMDNRQRLTIYYKERFDFGGGLGGGTRIDIGNKAISKPIAGELHYHELSHCAFDVGIVYPGFVEGIANFGAIFLLDALGRSTDAEAAIRSNRQGFKDDYLGRRMTYWRIQGYAPSCGFLLTPIVGKDAPARRAAWEKYRQFFRALRTGMPVEPRAAERIRYFAWHWGNVFGWELLGETAKARFPVVPEDQERVATELNPYLTMIERGERFAEDGLHGVATEMLEQVMKACPWGELADRAKFGLARVRAALDDAKGCSDLYRDLGVVPKWKICLPFYSRGIGSLFPSFPPERELDQAAEYPNPAQIARWMDAKTAPDGRVDLLDHGIGYPEDAACYALAILQVPVDVPDAVCFVGFDDVGAIWLEGALVEKWDDAAPWLRDQRVAAIPLKAGRNRLLVKTAHGRGPWGFSARVVHADRRPIEGLVFAAPAAKETISIPPEPKGHAVFSLDFEKTKTYPKAKLRVTVGGWDVDGKCLRRTVPGSVAWRKFTVSPFVSKDPPSGLVWLNDKDLATLTDFAVEVTFRRADTGVPHVAITLHGEEKDDGLSGHTFLVQDGGDGVEVRLEEYDRLVYRGTAKIAALTDHVVRITRRGRKLSCTVDGVPALESVDLEPLPRTGIGLMTWDKETGIVKVRVERLK